MVIIYRLVPGSPAVGMRRLSAKLFLREAVRLEYLWALA
jgi:hypothetical protein